jgi:hypothetical protein
MLLKKKQDESLPVQSHYIRRMIHLTNVPVHDEDDPVIDGDSSDVYIVICMTNEGSQRLRKAQYIQSDMAFKRVVNYFEFEMATVDRINNTSMFVLSSVESLSNLGFHRYNLLPCLCYPTNSCCTSTYISRN